MGIFSRIFGTDDVIKKASDGVYNGLDKAFYTDEERSEDFLKLLKAYEPFRLIQRLLAMVVCGAYVGVWILSAFLYVSSLFLEPCSKEDQCMSYRVEEGSKKLAEMNNETLGMSFAIIMGLYFGGGAINSLRKD